MSEDAVNKLQEIFSIILELPPDIDVTQASQRSTDKWDSMATVSLVAAIESEFNINIDVVDALRLTSYQTALLLLDEKLQ